MTVFPLSLLVNVFIQWLLNWVLYYLVHLHVISAPCPVNCSHLVSVSITTDVHPFSLHINVFISLFFQFVFARFLYFPLSFLLSLPIALMFGFVFFPQFFIYFFHFLYTIKRINDCIASHFFPVAFSDLISWTE